MQRLADGIHSTVPSRNQNQNNNNNNSNNRGKGKKNVKKDKNETSGIPIDKLQFSVGRNQIENHEKPIEHLANKAQNECGTPMAHNMSLNKKEFNLHKANFRHVRNH